MERNHLCSKRLCSHYIRPVLQGEVSLKEWTTLSGEARLMRLLNQSGLSRRSVFVKRYQRWVCDGFVSLAVVSRLFLVIEYVNGGDLMFHMQRQRKLPEEHAR